MVCPEKAREKQMRAAGSLFRLCAEHSFPEAFVFLDEPMLVDRELGYEFPAAAVVAISAVRDPLVFLRQWLQCQIRKPDPGGDQGAAAAALFEIQPANRKSIGRGTPFQIDINAPIQLRLRIAIRGPVAALGLDV